MSKKRKPNTRGLQPFDTDTGREAAKRPRVASEHVRRYMFTLTPTQAAWLRRHGNASAEVRRLIDNAMRDEDDPAGA